MPKYQRNVPIPGKTSSELYDRLSQDIDEFLKKITLGKVAIIKKPEEKKLHIQSPLLNAILKCEEGQIVVDAQLSLLAVPFRSRLDAGIDKWLARTFS